MSQVCFASYSRVRNAGPFNEEGAAFTRRSIAVSTVALLALGSFILGCGQTASQAAVVAAGERAPRVDFTPAVETLGRCSDRDPNRRAFFGDLHVHTSLSLDANIQGNRITPAMAYRFARGERVGIQPHDADGVPTRWAQLERPLDFAAVSDHAEFLGVVDVCADDESTGYNRMECRAYRDDPDEAFIWINAYLAQHPRRLDYPQLCGDDATACLAGEARLWVQIQNAAEAYYDRGEDCEFTTFVGYEWTGSPALSFRRVANMHRNVIFRNNIVPALPSGYLRSRTPQELFRSLDEECVSAESGCDVMVIPHNANLSNGTMFLPWIRSPWLLRKDFTPEQARERAFFEPLQEIFQHKGASECVPFGTTGDEACAFESVPYRGLAHAKMDRRETPDERDSLRYGLARGLEMTREIGVNAFEFGFIGSTDTHLGLPGAVEEFAFLGGGGAGESGAEGLPDRIFFSGGGLAGVWAEENSREGIYQAMRRREVYGTSGTRMRVRTFMGDDVPSDFCERTDRLEQGYEHGVPMGARLSSSASGPRLAILAHADLGTEAHPGAKLQQIEVIRGQLQPDGSVSISVIPVAGDPDAGAGRDPYEGCEPSDAGEVELCAVWEDPSYDASAPAFYYVRVFETPTCRWSTLQCLEEAPDCESPSSARDRACCAPSAGLHPRRCAAVDCALVEDEECCSEFRVEPMLRERAWSSPIFTGPISEEP